MAPSNVLRATTGSVSPASVWDPISAGMPCSCSNAKRQLRAPAPPLVMSVPSMSNRTRAGRTGIGHHFTWVPRYAPGRFSRRDDRPEPTPDLAVQRRFHPEHGDVEFGRDDSLSASGLQDEEHAGDAGRLDRLARPVRRRARTG